ncbi:TMV resistance protein N-like protein isoform X1 [Tanacetum coccineum]
MASSSVPTRGWTYEVFLSFRGDDTRENFVDHLHAALVQKGLCVFKDDVMLRRGKEIFYELLKAIQESKFAVVVFSKNYANSSWCLDELAKIMECQRRMGQKVLPVFYHVDPSDVRKQIGNFTLQKHVDKFKDEVNKWSEALAGAANLSGWHIPEKDNGGENAFINKIIQEILGDIKPRGNENNLIGIEFHMNELSSLLKIEETEEVHIIGIYGMGGIGKTTSAQALFRRIAYKFEGSSFVKDVRENSSSIKDICALQEKILKDILEMQVIIEDPEYGADMIQERFGNKKVLLVLDDVDDAMQLEYLAATHEWFGPGSRIIITTRDEHLLSDANAKYKPALLNADQAIELFSRHAFRKNSPPDGYQELSKRAIRSAGYLPLALKVLGSFFRGRHAGVWGSALDRLAKTPDSRIFETLKLSFDGLNVFEKKIFLDMACFFKGREKNEMTRVLDSFGFFATIGISALIERSLISVSNGRLDMHDLIQEMGWQIVHMIYPYSRLWQLEQIHAAIKEKRELKVIEAIVVPNNQCNVDVNMGFSADVFKSMKNLRLLHVRQKFTSAVPTILPNSLHWFCWDCYPFSSLPVAQMDKLVGIKIIKGRLQYLWKGQMTMLSLKFIYLQQLGCISRFPDVSMAPNIERLILSSCEYLLEVHESLGSLRRLVYLDLSNCGRLKRLPSRIEMESLETLILSFCTSLDRLPEFSPCMVKLSHINCRSCYRIKELPSSIRYLSTLNFLNLRGCMNLENIPSSIQELKYLKSLFLEDCPKLQKLPDEFGMLERLEELELGVRDDFVIYVGVPKSINMHSLTTLCSLKILDLNLRQIAEEDIPKNLHGLSSLERLNLSGNCKLTKLPTGISHLSSLKHLDLNECILLETLHGLPPGIEVLKASNCRSLQNIEDLAEEYESLYKIWLLNCQRLLEDKVSKIYLDKMLKPSFLKKWVAVEGSLSVTFPGSNVPSWFKEQQHGHQIALKLPLRWQARIMGFALCGVFMQPPTFARHSIEFSFENDGIVVPYTSEVDCIDATSVNDGNVWLGYIPFSFFQQMHHGNDFHHENWLHVTEDLQLPMGVANSSPIMPSLLPRVLRRDLWDYLVSGTVAKMVLAGSVDINNLQIPFTYQHILASCHNINSLIAQSAHHTSQDGDYRISLSYTMNRQEVNNSFAVPTQPTNSSQHDIRNIEKPKMKAKKGLWSLNEDQKLRDYVTWLLEYGPNQCSEYISKAFASLHAAVVMLGSGVVQYVVSCLDFAEITLIQEGCVVKGAFGIEFRK